MGGANFVDLGPVPDPQNDNVTVGMINATVTAATVALVTSVTGKRISVFGLFLTSSGAGPVTFADNATALTGPMTMSAGVPLSLPFQQYPWLACASGDALNVISTGTVTLSGRIIYMQG